MLAIMPCGLPNVLRTPPANLSTEVGGLRRRKVGKFGPAISRGLKGEVCHAPARARRSSLEPPLSCGPCLSYRPAPRVPVERRPERLPPYPGSAGDIRAREAGFLDSVGYFGSGAEERLGSVLPLPARLRAGLSVSHPPGGGRPQTGEDALGDKLRDATPLQTLGDPVGVVAVDLLSRVQVSMATKRLTPKFSTTRSMLPKKA